LTAIAYSQAPCQEYSPEVWDAILVTSKGNITITVNREWAVISADRFYSAMHCGHYKTDEFYWVLANKSVTFGLSGDPTEDATWVNQTFPSDIRLQSNTYGMVSFVQVEQYVSSATQVVVNLGTNKDYDTAGYPPFAQISADGMKVVESLYSAYGNSPDPNQILQQGNNYLQQSYPHLDVIHGNDAVITCPKSEKTCQYIEGDAFAIQCCPTGESCIMGAGCRCLGSLC